MIKAAIFDLDHTLFDRYATLRLVANCFREELKIAPGITDDYIAEQLIWADKQYVCLGWAHIHRHLIDCGIFAEEPTYKEYCDFVFGCFRRMAVPFDFTKPMLKELRDMGIKVGLITNGAHELQYRKLAMLDLTNDFDNIIATKDVGVNKPERGPFDIMAWRLGIPQDQMLYIGDNPLNDVEGSRRAGYIPVWVRTTGVWAFPELEKPPLQVDTVAEIPDLIRKLNAE